MKLFGYINVLTPMLMLLFAEQEKNLLLHFSTEFTLKFNAEFSAYFQMKTYDPKWYMVI